MARGTGKGEGVSSGVLKIILIVLNTVFLLIGGLLIAVGAYALIGSDKLSANANDVIDALPALAEASNLTSFNEPDGKLELDATVLSKDFAIAFIVVGGILFIVSVEGFCGLFCEEEAALIVYAVFIGVMLMVQVACVIAFFAGALVGPVQERLTTMIEDEYAGIDNYQSESVLWNVLMINFECCGLKDYKDFKKAKKWDNERDFGPNNETMELTYPIACCQLENNYKGFKSTQCPMGEDDDASNYKTGCWGELVKFLEQFKTQAIVAVAIVLLFQVALIIILAIFIKKLREDKITTIETPRK